MKELKHFKLKKMEKKEKEKEKETQKKIVEMAKIILGKMGIVENQFCTTPDGLMRQFITPYWYNFYLEMTINEINGFVDSIHGKQKEGK